MKLIRQVNYPRNVHSEVIKLYHRETQKRAAMKKKVCVKTNGPPPGVDYILKNFLYIYLSDYVDPTTV